MAAESQRGPEPAHEMHDAGGASDRQSSNQKATRARVKLIKASRAMVTLLPGGEEAWMPAQEMYPDFKPHSDFREIAKADGLEGKEIEVVQYGHAVDGKRLVSHIRVKDDPWEKVAGWPDKSLKLIEVTALTNVRAVGIIQPGIRGQIMLKPLREAFPPSWRAFVKPLPGDEIAGFFCKDAVDSENRIVTLDVLGYIRSKVSIQAILAPAMGVLDAASANADLEGKPPTEAGNSTAGSLDIGGIETILVVDDNVPFVRALSELLEKEGSTTLRCASYDEALKVVSDDRREFELAIIDVHLTPSVDDYLGLPLAREVKSHHPRCRIILMSMEDIDAACESVKATGDLKVSAFLAKPFTVAHLYEAFADMHQAPRPVSDVLPGGQSRDIAVCDSGENTTGIEEVDRIADRLCRAIDAEAVVLFSIDPSSYEVGIVAKSDETGKYSVVKPKLDRSPIHDVAIDGELVFEGAASSPWRLPKHLYLNRAYGYESCIGVNVTLGRASPLAYAVFAFHPRRNKFSAGDRNSVKLAAREFGVALHIMTYEEELRRMKRFELMGKTYGSLAHDIANSLTTIGIKLKNLEHLLGNTAYSDMASVIKELTVQNETTTQIVNLFKAMAKAKRRTLNIVLDEAISKVVEYFKQFARTKYGVSIKFVCSAPVSCEVQMPEGALDQLMYNLMLNAVQQIERLGEAMTRDADLKEQIPRFTDSEKGEVVVELKRTTDGEARESAVILVHDSGPGIHRCDFGRVFDLHYTTKEEGCGMGLDICRNIAHMVEANGRKGSLTVRRSILFVGTTFEVRLPLM